MVVKRFFPTASMVREAGETIYLTAAELKMYEPRFVRRVTAPARKVTKSESVE